MGVTLSDGPLAAGTFTDRQFDAHLIGGTGADGESLLNYGYSVNALDDLDGDGSSELGISGGGDMLDIHFGGGW